MTASHAFLARTRVPNTGPRRPVCDTDPARRGGIDLNAKAHEEYRQKARAQRTYRVEFKPDLHPGSDLHWQMRPYGPGHWCRCDGQPHWLRSEEEAHAVGKRWIETGRTR